MVVSAVGMAAWKAHRSNDGGNGSRNPVRAVLFDGAIEPVATAEEHPSRSATAGQIRVPLRGCDTFVAHAAELWNMCPALRESELDKEPGQKGSGSLGVRGPPLRGVQQRHLERHSLLTGQDSRTQPIYSPVYTHAWLSIGQSSIFYNCTCQSGMTSDIMTDMSIFYPL
jgi:hypothetical protein